MRRPVTVLHVDDDPGFLELAATHLGRDEDLTERTESSAEAALKTLATADVDCVVSDYDMPGMDGVELLETTRDRGCDLPFILLTGKGSEEIASHAISAGVDDYVQKGHTEDEFLVLANRVKNAVAQHRTEAEIRETRRRFKLLVEQSTDAILIVDPAGEITYATPTTEHVLGRSPAELVGSNGFDPIHPEDREAVVTEFQGLLDAPDTMAAADFRYRHADDEWIWVESRGRNMIDTPVIGGIVIYTREISDRKTWERELDRYRTICETIPVAAWIANPDGELEFVNGHLAEQLGTGRSDLVGRDFVAVLNDRDLVGPDAIAAYRAHRAAVLDPERDPADPRLDPSIGAGSGVTDLHLVPLESDGAVAGVVGVARFRDPAADAA